MKTFCIPASKLDYKLYELIPGGSDVDELYCMHPLPRTLVEAIWITRRGHNDPIKRRSIACWFLLVDLLISRLTQHYALSGWACETSENCNVANTLLQIFSYHSPLKISNSLASAREGFISSETFCVDNFNDDVELSWTIKNCLQKICTSSFDCRCKTTNIVDDRKVLYKGSWA